LWLAEHCRASTPEKHEQARLHAAHRVALKRRLRAAMPALGPSLMAMETWQLEALVATVNERG